MSRLRNLFFRPSTPVANHLVHRRSCSPSKQAFSTTSDSSAEWVEHREIVNEISAAVQKYYSRGERFRISHGSTNSTRNPLSKGTNFVDTSRLSRVLTVDPEKQIALVEPNVSMDRLVEATLPHSMIPPVVMEFPGITTGGGYAGTSGESSSFRHGFFDRNVRRAEIVLGNGEVVEATRNERSDLLHGAAGAVGTLGITTLLEIQLVPARKYVLAKYQPVASFDEAVRATSAAMENPDNDYVDGIIFSQNHGVIITGTLKDECDEKMAIQTFSRPRDPWFYLHVQERTKNTTEPAYEAIPLAEYLFRYDRGGFWVGAAAFKYFYTPFNSWTRWFMDDFMHTRMLYKALHASGYAARFVVQDLALPFDKAAEFMNFTTERLGIFPLWLCPLRQSPLPTMHPHHSAVDSVTGELKPLLNIGVWGNGPQDRSAFIKANQELEAKLAELEGMKWLYAHAYYREADFWSQFDQKWYHELRAKYHASHLPNVFDKVRVQIDPDSKPSFRERMLDTWPLTGLYGVRAAIASKAYRHDRASTWMNRPTA